MVDLTPKVFSSGASHVNPIPSTELRFLFGTPFSFLYLKACKSGLLSLAWKIKIVQKRQLCSAYISLHYPYYHNILSTVLELSIIWGWVRNHKASAIAKIDVQSLSEVNERKNGTMDTRY